MRDKFEVKTGNIAVEMLGITNYEELQKFLGEKNANEVICTKETKVSITENLKHYKSIRTPLKKTRAEANKMIKSEGQRILGEFDEAIKLVSDYIEPYETAVKTYDDKVKLDKLNRLRNDVMPRLEDLNARVDYINQTLDYRLIEPLEFSEDWAKSVKTACEYIDTYGKDAQNKFDSAENNIEAVWMLCEKLKNEYDLISTLNYKNILGNDIFTGKLADMKETLDDAAMNQQTIEVEAAEKAIEDEKRKAEKERLAAEKQQAKLDGEKKQIEVEKETKVPQTIENAISKDHIVEIEKETYSKTIKFPKLTNKDTNLMIQYFEDNDIEWEVM